jgi:hypothetical protein
VCVAETTLKITVLQRRINCILYTYTRYAILFVLLLVDCCLCRYKECTTLPLGLQNIMSSLLRFSRSITSSKRIFKSVGAVRYAGAAANDPAFASAPGGYPEVKFKKDINDYVASTNDDEAYFCGRKPGTPLEGWEPMFGIVMAGMVIGMIMISMQDDKSLEVGNNINVHMAFTE